MKNFIKKLFTKKMDTLDKILDSKNNCAKSVIAYISILDKKEKEVVLERALDFYINEGSWSYSEEIATELCIKLSDNQKIKIIKVNIKENKKNISAFLELAESINDKDKQKIILEELLKVYIEINSFCVDKTLVLLNRDLRENELEKYLIARISDGHFFEAQEIAKTLNTSLTQDQLEKVFDNHFSFSSSISESEIELIKLIKEPSRTQKIQKLIPEKDFENALILIQKLPEPVKTLELKSLIQKEDKNGRMHLSSKLEAIGHMGNIDKMRNIDKILDQYLSSDVVLPVGDFKEISKFLSNNLTKKRGEQFLKMYIDYGLYGVSCEYALFLQRNLSATELDILLEVSFTKKNFRSTRWILEDYSDDLRNTKIKYFFEKTVELNYAPEGAKILNHFYN